MRGQMKRCASAEEAGTRCCQPGPASSPGSAVSCWGFVPVAVGHVLPLAAQQHGGDAVLALQQRPGVQTAAEHVQQSRNTDRSSAPAPPPQVPGGGRLWPPAPPAGSPGGLLAGCHHDNRLKHAVQLRHPRPGLILAPPQAQTSLSLQVSHEEA